MDNLEYSQKPDNRGKDKFGERCSTKIKKLIAMNMHISKANKTINEQTLCVP